MSLNVKGQLKEAQAENISGDPSNLPHGRTWYDTAINKLKTSISGVAKIIPTVDSTDTFTNKSISFGIISDTLSYTNQGSDVSAPAAGFTNTYTKSTGLFYRTPSNIRQVVNLDEAQTLTNKTINGSNNTITNVSLTTSVAGVLPVANGGTNSNTALNNNRIMRSSGGAIGEAAAITANRALISDANGIPTHANTTNTELNLLVNSLAHQSYTPVVTGGTVAGTGTYTTQVGGYTRFGQLIFFWFRLTLSAHTGTGTYNISIPVTSLNTTNYVAALNIAYIDSITLPASTYVTGLIAANSGVIALQSATVGGGAGSGLAIDGTGSVFGSGWYVAN